MNDKLCYSKKEVAHALSVSIMTVHRLLKSGKLPATRIGGRVVVYRDDLIQFIKDRRQIGIDK